MKIYKSFLVTLCLVTALLALSQIFFLNLSIEDTRTLSGFVIVFGLLGLVTLK